MLWRMVIDNDGVVGGVRHILQDYDLQKGLVPFLWIDGTLIDGAPLPRLISGFQIIYGVYPHALTDNRTMLVHMSGQDHSGWFQVTPTGSIRLPDE